MDIEDESLLELISEEDFYDVSLVERVAKRIFSQRDPEIVRTFLKKLHFAFLANDEGYRTQILERLANLSTNFSLDELFSMCFDTLVGNYLILLIVLKQNPILNTESIKGITELVPRLECMEDLYLFGFPYQGEVILEIDERIGRLKLDEIKKTEITCNLLFGLGFFRKSREAVESFLRIYSAMNEPDFNLRSQLISALFQRDFNQFSFIMQKFGYKLESEEQIISEYFELMKSLERLSIPVFFEINNLRFNRVLFNGNFYFLKYKNFEGKDRIVFPFSQVELSDVSKIYDPRANMFYTPRERYGRLVLGDVYSLREAVKVDKPSYESITNVTSMSEDYIEKRLREILKDANLTAHSPVELADVLTLHLFVNNPDDLRLSGFIIKGQSFGSIHLNTIAGQLLQVSHSPVEIVFLIHVPSIDDRALQYFIQECESKQKNYCIIDRNDLARIFMAYKMI